MENRTKRFLAVVLAFVLAFGMVTPGFATDGEGESQVVSDTNHLDADETAGPMEVTFEDESDGVEADETTTPNDLPQMEVQTTSPAALTITPFNISTGNVIYMSDADPDTSGDGWTFANNIYTIEDSANVIIRGSNAGSQRRLAVATNATNVNITL